MDGAAGWPRRLAPCADGCGGVSLQMERRGGERERSPAAADALPGTAAGGCRCGDHRAAGGSRSLPLRVNGGHRC